ncbi:MAG: acyltransferase family protein [Acidobacteria bacterium]|nr:acyltransferase family protein [Acidobacteriota bacterium]NIM62363.1 acyltransferase family protein [Acidobacteriota bacterium]NIO60672.1 acyltransferase family protein [Acidobacteriota bacterium]NIQ31738.1 acyltransferase family protein [Acidobacteriota bacterium]NIQ87043.1 acyltransferase family protein [Acidobacteriota bacterium]
MAEPSPRRGAWNRALELADATPESRNRYVDLLRAVSIGAVVCGHWMIAAPWMDDGRLRFDHVLAIQPWTQWLTWLFQVMPVFFMVGGYSNAVSWDSAQRAGRSYGAWIGARMRRLFGPVVPLLVAWGLLGLAARWVGVPPEAIRTGSQVSVVPLWFLAVYVLVALFTPLSRAAWNRFGVGSFWCLAAAAVFVDYLRFGLEIQGLPWINYLLVWSAVHQLGYLWRDGRFDGPSRSLTWALGGAALMAFLVLVAGYPRSMVGVPGEEVSNTLPPSIAMLGLGLTQAGLLLALQGPARRLLSGRRAWAATIVVNANIMSIYLWHSTAMVLWIGLSWLLGGVGLSWDPGSGAWWAARPPWMLLYGLLLIALLAIFGRFERLPMPDRPLAMWRTVLGAVLLCVGLGRLAITGIAGPGSFAVRSGALFVALAGALVVGAVPFRRRSSDRERT